MISRIKDDRNLTKLFPKNPHEIKNLVKNYTTEAKEKIEKIIAIPLQEKTYKNTPKQLDELSSLDNISIYFSCLSALEMLSPEKEIRDASHKALLTLQKFWVDNISNNVKLYKALKTYDEKNLDKADLTQEEKYFITETLKDYKRAGLDLPKEKLEQVKKINKELGELGLTFETNIATDQSTIQVKKENLEGVNQELINNLEKTEEGDIILRTDYPTYFTVMDNCKVEETRKKFYLAFNNRAYPKNEELLKKIIEKRDKLAKLLGFASYGELDLDDQMAKNPKIAKEFLLSLHTQASEKTKKEFEELTSDLPESIQLTLLRQAPLNELGAQQDDRGRVKAWDLRYLKNQYKKKHLQIDEQKIAEYFPTENTIKELLNIYEAFLDLTFKVSDIKNLWHPDTKLVEIYTKKDNTLLGYLILDLHPRANKYSHACQMTIIPAVKNHGPSVCIVVANFPKSTKDKPSLLQLNDVETFFHELGHALHAILGRTTVGSFAGTSVKTDFVEIPSQMLEEWLSDKEILKKISRHYKTGEFLDDKTIENILKLKQFDSGDFLQRQCYLSILALDYFDNGAKKDPKAIRTNLLETMRSHIIYDPDDNMYASFGHLSGYGAKYYSYMWSKVYALDMFSKIKEYGLLNPEIGQRYINEVLAKGGSQDPNILIKNFLQREPSQTAFLENLGID